MDSRQAMFVVQIVWLLILGALAAAVLTHNLVLPDSLGSIPIGVVWFGALGAVLISLTGIVGHADDWKSSYVLWHLSRPLMGASLAVVSVLIMQAGILAVGSAPATGAAATAPKNILYYLVAFLVGYREETFRELIKRLVDLLLAPAPAPAKGAPAPAVVGKPAAAPEPQADNAKIPIKETPGKGEEATPH